MNPLNLVSLAALYVASLFTNPVAAQEVAKPSEPEKPKFSVYDFTEFNAETESFFSKLKPFYDDKVILSIARAKGIETNLSSRWFIRPGKDLDGFLDVYGRIGDDGNNGIGISASAQANVLRAGATAEFAESANGLDHVVGGYAGLKAGNLTLDAGVSNIKQGESRTAVHGTSFFTVPGDQYTFIVGGGGIVDTEGSKYVHGTTGYFPNQSGKGIGALFSVTSHLSGDVSLEGVFAFNAAMGAGYFSGDHGITERLHESSLRLLFNPLDRGPNAGFNQWTTHTATFGARYNRDAQGNDILTLETAVYPFGVARELADLPPSFLDTIWSGMQIDFPSSGNPVLFYKAGIQTSLGEKGNLLFYGSKADGQKPILTIELDLKF